MQTWADGAVALVTGAGSGLGRAAAEELALQGVRVAVVGHTAAAADDVRAAIVEAGGTAMGVQADVSREADCARMVDAVLSEWGRLDAACNAAGVTSSVGLEAHEIPVDEWNRVLATDLTGVWLSMKHELVAMRAQGSGAIVNVSSVGGLRGIARSAAYVASKHAVVGLTRTAALESAASGVRVNCVCPGTTDTEMLEQVFDREPSRRALYESRTPIGRIAEPVEVARAIAFLLSQDASYMQGAAMPVDGGWTAQ
jgi:NAD(P)-dependent dehydrogenase (short-subunit alcohol dehydrogenase family)